MEQVLPNRILQFEGAPIVGGKSRRLRTAALAVALMAATVPSMIVPADAAWGGWRGGWGWGGVGLG